MESWRRNLEKSSWRKNHGGAIMEETSGKIWKPPGSNLGSIRKSFGARLGSICGTFGRSCAQEASGRQISDYWYTSQLTCNSFPGIYISRCSLKGGIATHYKLQVKMVPTALSGHRTFQCPSYLRPWEPLQINLFGEIKKPSKLVLPRTVDPSFCWWPSLSWQGLVFWRAPPLKLNLEP